MLPTPFYSRMLNIKTLIVFLAFLVMFITLVNTLYASYKVQKNQLIKHTLDTNQAYTQKLAAATDDLINAAYEQLGFAANIIGTNFSDLSVLMQEAERIQYQTRTFNSVTVVSKEGEILAASSNRLNIIGLTLTVGGGPEAIAVKKTLVGTPHLTRAGELLLLISYPIFNAKGEYLGYLGGSLYLKKDSILNELLGEHFHQDGSYIYVVDKNKQLIYHPEQAKVGEFVLDKVLIELTQLMQKVSRKQDIVARTGGEEFLLILPSTPSDLAWTIAERLRERVAKMQIEPVGKLTVSIGIATSSKHIKPNEELLKRADLAMYQAKKLGRNRCELAN